MHNVGDEAARIHNAQEDPQAFSVLFDAYYQQILNYAVHRLGDMPLAEDITAESFLKAFKNIRSYQWRGVPFSAWLYRIVGNEINAHFRKQKFTFLSYHEQSHIVDNLPNDTELEAELVAAEEQLARHQLFLTAQREIVKLPVKYQEVITLRYFEKKKIKEIALILNKKPGTVKSLLSRGITRLGRTLPVQPFTGASIIQYVNSEQRKDAESSYYSH